MCNIKCRCSNIFLAALFSCVFCIRALAAASPSDAEQNPIYGYIEELLKEIDYDDLDDMEKLNLLDMYIASLSGPGLASGSDADLADIRLLLSDIHAQIVPAAPDDDTEEAGLVEPDAGLAVYASGGFNIDRNVVIYSGRFSNQACYLVLPSAAADTLWVDPSDGAIYNVGTSNIVGRIFYGDADLTSYTQYVFTLTPSLGNNASTLYNYGYPSYRRYYYYSGGGLRSSDTYGLFYVQEVINTPSDVPARVNGYYLLALILIGGVQVLCLMKKLRN